MCSVCCIYIPLTVGLLLHLNTGVVYRLGLGLGLGGGGGGQQVVQVQGRDRSYWIEYILFVRREAERDGKMGWK
jgi:hypothetical protein